MHNQMSTIVKEKELMNLEINQMIANVDSFIRKEYLSELGAAKIVPLSNQLSDISVGSNVRLFKLSSLSYATTDDLYEKIISIYSALSGFDASQVLILDSDGYKADIYLGIVSNKVEKLGMEFDTFKGSFLGNFPGGKINILNKTKISTLIHNIFDEPNIKISCVSALTTNDQSSKQHVYGMERLVDGMHGKPFTMVLISDSVDKNELVQLRKSLEAMYTELSPYATYNLSLNNSINETYTENFNMTKSESVTNGISVSENTTLGKSKNKSTTINLGQETKQKDTARNQVIGTAASIAAIMSGLGGANIGLLQGLFYGGSISNVLGSAQTLMNGADVGANETSGEAETYSISFSESETTSKQEGFSTTKGISDATSKSDGKTIQMQYENKSIQNLLEVLDKQIKRIQHIEEIGGFNCATYFVAGDNTTAQIAANMYKSLLGNGNSLCQNNAINIFSDAYRVEAISEYLKRLNHPVFHFESKVGYPKFSACSIVSSDEFPLYAALPKKSITGLPVVTRGEFGRDVTTNFVDSSDALEIGHNYHLGKEESTTVKISVQNLRGHMFVAGSTGMGKSNYCYGLLHKLRQNGIKFMVIEPAKGEYDRVFGGLEDIHVFGTNPLLKPLLRINPFSFPCGIHVNEHIDRLLEIFNSCWPMYAAMPQVLKESLETIYKKCGYNLVTGKTRKPNKFPSFKDLLEVMPEIINQSAFSSEVKGNYIGSLVTRFKSLTDGVYGLIFNEDEINYEILFDENTLIDLSRVGSGETKSLIMGLLVMKLQEYRMTKTKMNQKLQHVTLLEEAHHLLKAGGNAGAEGVNLKAMSLEMIANAIAEMRTYGEGFIIADQSPNLLDSTVIRNTNTKVIFKLQENADRQTIGNALSLDNAQINELSRLECGVAVVYQSNWDNPILSKIHYYGDQNFAPYQNNEDIFDIDELEIQTQLIAYILKPRLETGKISSFDLAVVQEYQKQARYLDPTTLKILEMLKHVLNDSEVSFSFAQICKIIDKIIDTKKLMKTCGQMDDIQTWETNAKQYLAERVYLNEAELEELILLCINIRLKDHIDMKQFYVKYYAYLKKTTKMTFPSAKLTK